MSKEYEGCHAFMKGYRPNHHAVATFSVNKGDEALELSMFHPKIQKSRMHQPTRTFHLVLESKNQC